MRPQFLGAFAAMAVFAHVEGSTGSLGDRDSVGLRGAEGTAEISGGKDSGAITTAGEIRRRLTTTSTDVGEVITMAPTSTPTLQGSVCDNGVPGIQTGDACCLAECGQCGGSNCHLFGGGLGERNCCQSDIEDGGELCSVAGVAPCVVDDAPTPAPGLPTPPPAVAPTPAPTLAPVVALTPAPTPSPGVAPTPTPTTAPVVSPTPTPTTTPISPAGPYGFVACRVDDRRDRVMSVGPIVKSAMSAEICFGLCIEDDPSYNYFGTQYGSECFCSNTLEDSPDSSRCDFPCASITTGEICGGFDAISVYEIEKAPTPAPVTVITPEGPYESIGCRTDDRNDRVMSLGPIVKSAMSAQICFGICLDEGPSYNYFGTQYGSECFCSESLQASPDSNQCDFPCASIGTGEICGGFDAISVYQYSEGSDNNNDDDSDQFTSLGCFEDLRDGSRAMESKMTDQSTTEMSAEICYNICVGEGANYFGLQWSFECWCSNTFSETSSAVCDMPCIGNFGEICGGFDAIEAFSIDQDEN